jgi:uncharacterized protein (DUF885 family)
VARRPLVVDTGIHSMGWDKARAIQFMRENTALSEANIEAEVNRYISWPGQALGYMIGRLKILELRRRAEQALGDKFDLRRFTMPSCSTAPSRSTCWRRRSEIGSRAARGEGRH